MRRFLVALAMAGAASSLAITSPVAEKRAANSCPKSLKSAWGVDFDTMCGTNQPGWDTFAPGSTDVITSNGDNITDCATQCNAQPGPCRGVVFTISRGLCYFKNSTFEFVSGASVDDADTNLAIPVAGQVQSFPTRCPFDNSSVQQSDQSQNFTIHCNQDIVGADYNPSGLPLHQGYPYHTGSLGDCMNLCSNAAPQCQGVAWNPDLTEGFGNCYLKTNGRQNFTFVSRNGNTDDNADGNPSVIHTAVARFPNVNGSCSEGGNVRSENGTEYTLQCDQDQGGNDIQNFHANSLEECVTGCEQLTDGNCVGVVLDTQMTNGFQNCYLKSGVGAPQENKDGFIFARKGDSNSDDGGSSSNVSAIAGGTVGGVVALAAIAAAAFWYWRRRRALRAAPGAGGSKANEAGGFYAALPNAANTPPQEHAQQQWQKDYKHAPADGAAGGGYGWAAAPPAHQDPPVELEGVGPAAPQELPSGEAGGAELPAAGSPVPASELPSEPAPRK